MSENDFDKKEIYSERILPLLDELYDICRMNRIPFFFSALTEMHRKEDGEMSMNYERCCLHPGEYNEQIPKNEISKHIAVSCGFDVVFQSLDESDLPNEYLKEINAKPERK